MNGFQVMLMFAQSAGKFIKYFPVQNVKAILLKMQQYVPVSYTHLTLPTTTLV